MIIKNVAYFKISTMINLCISKRSLRRGGQLTNVIENNIIFQLNIMGYYPFEEKIRAVEMLVSGKSRTAVAEWCGAHLLTVRRWLRRYKKAGTSGLLDKRIYGNHKRISRSTEKEVVLIKEKYPFITVKQARLKLKRNGVNCSEVSIWRIWVKYGMAGLNPQNFSLTFSYGTPEAPYILHNKRLVEDLVAQKKTDEAAVIVNRLPVFPYRELLVQIPERRLSLYRRRDALSYYLSDPKKYYRKAVRLRKKFERSEKYYSALICGVNELLALQWLGRIEEGISLINHLRQKLATKRSKYFSFTFDLFEGVFWCTLLGIDKAVRMMKRCEKNRSRLLSPFMMGNLAGLCAFLGYNRKAILYLNECTKQLSIKDFPIFHLNLALCYCRSGDYHTAERILVEIKKSSSQTTVHAFLVEARIFLIKGDFSTSLHLCRSVLRDIEKRDIPHYIHAVTFMESAVYSALNEKERARDILQRYDSYLFKHKLYREFEMRKMLEQSSGRSNDLNKIKVFHLFSILQKARGRYLTNYYVRAVRYAEKHSLLGFLHLFTLFHTEPVKKLLKKGKDPRLPTSMLEFPVFEQAASSYRIAFLGPLRVDKDGKRIKQRIPPRIAALLIQLAVFEKRRITVDQICNNFWHGSQNRKRNLSQVLSRLRKILSTSRRYLKITQGKILVRHFLTTDYAEFKMALSKAKTFERAEEWNYARDEYLRAFRLFRGEPINLKPRRCTLQRDV